MIAAENEIGVQQNISNLGFIPDYYSANYQLITEIEIDWLQSMGIGVLPWTINERADMLRFLSLGVEGIITDYPALLLELVAKKG